MKNTFSNTYTVDASFFKSKNKTHKYLKKLFKFPDYYGANLDALWDLLTEISEETDINLKNIDAIPEKMKEYSEQIIDLFQEWDDENDLYHFHIIKK